MIMVRKEFEYDIMGEGSRFKAPTGFKEADLRQYGTLGNEQIEEQLNNALKSYESKSFGLRDEEGNVALYGASTGDVQVDIAEYDNEVEVSVYRLIRRWSKPKKVIKE